MKQAAIWLISGGPMQVKIALEIKRAGYCLIVSDRNSSAICRKIADEFVELDTFDVGSHIQVSEKIREKFMVSAVITAAADCHYTVACLGRHLGVHHIDPEVSKICRNKALTRKVLENAEIPQPWSTSASNYNDAIEIVRQSTFDLVLKATDNSGSRGLQTISRGAELTKDQFEYTQGFGSTGTVIIEKKLKPVVGQVSESSVETIWQDGKMYWFNWVDRIFACDTVYFSPLRNEPEILPGIELGHINPAQHPPEIKEQVMHLMQRAGLAIGMGTQRGGHVLKGDIYHSDDGPIILELTPRCSGGWDSSGSTPARGANLAGGLVQLALGRTLDLDLWHQYFEFKYPEITSVVMATIPKDASDCIGRSFVLAFGDSISDAVMTEALNKRAKGEYIVPIL